MENILVNTQTKICLFLMFVTVKTNFAYMTIVAHWICSLSYLYTHFRSNQNINNETLNQHLIFDICWNVKVGITIGENINNLAKFSPLKICLLGLALSSSFLREEKDSCIFFLNLDKTGMGHKNLNHFLVILFSSSSFCCGPFIILFWLQLTIGDPIFREPRLNG